MIRYLLDTTPLSAFIRRRRAATELIEPWLARSEVATSVLAYAEVVEYLRGQARFEERYHALREVLSSIEPIGLDLPVLDRYSLLRRQLRPPHGPGLIGDIDTFIAATALERGLMLVTSDGDFRRVPNLGLHFIPQTSFHEERTR